MGKKLKLLPSLFKNREEQGMMNPWQWGSCALPKTQSFRDQDIFKTVNSVFFDPTVEGIEAEASESLFSHSSETASFSTESEDHLFDGEMETVLQGVKSSERLFFQPGDTNSILEEAKKSGFPFKESVVLAMESEDPYVDFRRSMEEMVATHGLKDWDCLEELLGWYLRVNGKKNHGYIVGAFVDVLVGLAGGSSNSGNSTSYSTAVSSFPSSPSCSIGGENEIEEIEKIVFT